MLLCYAQKAGFFYHAAQSCSAPAYGSFHIIDSGMVIISRFPIIYSEFMAFSANFGSSSELSRGCLYAKISIGKSVLHLFNVHPLAMEFSGPVDDVFRTIECRNECF
jgi:hypothetical protein